MEEWGRCRKEGCCRPRALGSIYCRQDETGEWIDYDNSKRGSEQVATTRTEEGELIFWVGCRSHRTLHEAQVFLAEQMAKPPEKRYRTVWERMGFDRGSTDSPGP